MTKYILSFATLALSTLGAVGQMADHCVAFSIGKPKEQATLTVENLRSLELKCTQIITRSNAAKTALYSAFVITPSLDLLGDRQVMAGTADITVIEAELTLVAENSIDGSKYGSVTVKLEGSGNSRARAINSLMQSIQPTSGVFVNFIKKATAQITDYYSNNMGRVLTQAQNLMAAERYDDALNFLNSVPICVPAFEQSADAIAGLIKAIADKNCNAALVMARRYASIGDYTNAQEVLLGVKAGSVCDAEIQALLGSIGAKKDSIEATKPPVAVVADPMVAPTSVTVPTPVAATKSEEVSVKNPFRNLSFKMVGCEGTRADNQVLVTIIITNRSDTRQDIYFPYTSQGIMLYGENGQSFECSGLSERSFKLPSELSQRFTFRFSDVGTKTSKVSFVVTLLDTTGNKPVEFRNLTIDWQ